MPTRFNATPQPVMMQNGKDLVVMGRKTDEHKMQLLAGLAAGDLEKAKTYILKTIALLQKEPLDSFVIQYADRYFITGSMSTHNRQFLISVLVKTLNGLSSDVTLKVGDNVGRNDKDVYGSVGISTTKPATKGYHNIVDDYSKGVKIRTGAIRLAKDSLGTDQGVVTLIHEATHKYAGTWDYAYFTDDGKYPRDAFHTRGKAMENADSYAWFVERIGKF